MWLVSIFVLVLLLPISYEFYVQYPVNITTCPEATAVFDCAATDAQTIYYLVNGSSAISSQNKGVSVSIFFANGTTLVKLNFTATSVGITEVLCEILLVNNTFLKSAAYLNVQAPPTAPTGPIATVLNSTAVTLSWMPSVGYLSMLTYIVEIKSPNGTVMFHNTVEVPQLLIVTANTCDLYEAAISAKCTKINGTSTAVSIRLSQETCMEIHPSPLFVGKVIGGALGGFVVILVLLCIIFAIYCYRGTKKVRYQSSYLQNHRCSYYKKNNEMKPFEQIPKEEVPFDLNDDTRLGREYKGFSVIGKGETAVVLRAESKDHSYAGKYYAIKITAKSTNDAVDKEARALTILDQLPGIVRYIDRWAEQPPKDWQNRSPWKYFADGAPVDCFEFRYQKTDYISEGNMEDWVLKEKIMGRKDIRSTFDQLARTMSDVHKLGVSHQDLCLQNIFVSKNPASEQIVFKIGGFTSPLLKEDASENNFVETCQKDIWSLGYILLQLMYFKKHHTLSHITSIHSEQQEMTQQFKELTADAKSVIKFFCGNDLCQSGFHNLSEALEHRTYKRWLKQCEQPSQRLMKQYDDMKPLEQISMEDASFLLNDDTRLGKEYKCFSVIRKEDKAVVLRAESKDPSICGKYYAIKITVKSTNDDDMDKEARALTILDQLPGIVRYIDRWAEQPPKDWQNRSPWKHFADDAPVDSFEFHYLKTDHFSEGNMKDWVAKEKIKDMNIIGSIFDELATTTSHIHKLGVSHCNLCLINIFVTMNPVSDQCDLKIGGFTSPLFKKDSVEEVFVGACQEDIWSLGCILLQLMYFRRHQTLPHITSNHSDQQEWVTQQFKELELTAALKSLIQIFCGNDLLGTQLQNLSQALVHPTYKKWMKQCEGV